MFKFIEFSPSFPFPLTIQGQVQFRINSEGVTWSMIFKVLEENRADLGIVDYQLSQTSLEQVITAFCCIVLSLSLSLSLSPSL